ncbi:hypothetical protein ARMSODRAFT_339502 [Armillaria solidipes]|uniref:Uncharacterized protein n=1 Tax=Armillaria solidipes TaxID=1076256 RepID=A0A2H3B714_9AGAR|nr:hypothetical protein ARMSODRAFT_339502 [Armillaria solidipes]
MAEVPHAIFTAYLGIMHSFATGLVFLSLALAMGNRTVLKEQIGTRRETIPHRSTAPLPRSQGIAFTHS